MLLRPISIVKGLSTRTFSNLSIYRAPFVPSSIQLSPVSSKSPNPTASSSKVEAAEGPAEFSDDKYTFYLKPKHRAYTHLLSNQIMLDVNSAHIFQTGNIKNLRKDVKTYAYYAFHFGRDLNRSRAPSNHILGRIIRIDNMDNYGDDKARSQFWAMRDYDKYERVFRVVETLAQMVVDRIPNTSYEEALYLVSFGPTIVYLINANIPRLGQGEIDFKVPLLLSPNSRRLKSLPEILGDRNGTTLTGKEDDGWLLDDYSKPFSNDEDGIDLQDGIWKVPESENPEGAELNNKQRLHPFLNRIWLSKAELAAKEDWEQEGKGDIWNGTTTDGEAHAKWIKMVQAHRISR